MRLNLPGNSVSVERGVKDVTGAAKVCAKIRFTVDQLMNLNGFRKKNHFSQYVIGTRDPPPFIANSYVSFPFLSLEPFP